jgi:hypothetical protein
MSKADQLAEFKRRVDAVPGVNGRPLVVYDHLVREYGNAFNLTFDDLHNLGIQSGDEFKYLNKDLQAYIINKRSGGRKTRRSRKMRRSRKTRRSRKMRR